MIKMLLLSLFLVGCSSHRVFKTNECFVDLNGESFIIYQVMDSTKETYITERISHHYKEKITQWHPVIVSKEAKLAGFDCIHKRKLNGKSIEEKKETEVMKKWTKAILKLRKMYGIDK